MHPDVKIKLKKEIEVFLEKNPESNVSDLRRFLKLGSTGDLIAQFKKSSFSMFLKRNYEKFKETGSCSQHKCGNGRKKTAARTRARIKALVVNKKKRSLRGVAGLTGVSKSTVSNILHEDGCKAYKKYRTQKMTDVHKVRRVQFCQYLLQNWAKKPNEGSTWFRLINTDFSAKIRVNPTRNSKNDVVWSHSRDEAGDKLEAEEEKYSASVMIWGGVCAQGLVPSDAPIFVCDLYEEYEPPHPKTINGVMYADLIREKASRAARRIYPAGNAIFQDDGATIHRCPAALAAVNDCFRYRVDPALQAPKMADFWPIENVWGILKQKISQKESKNLKQLRTNIVTAWREINADKDLCRRMMVSLPKRAAAIVRKNGSQITKNDY